MNRRRSAGSFLSEAASLAFGAQRLMIAALIRLEDAEANVDDLDFIAEARVVPVDLPALCRDLGIFSGNLLHLADAYGHYQVALRTLGCR
jgi:hypothetical protein